MTASQFAWSIVGGDVDATLAEPPERKRGERYGAAPDCWLCGGDTDGAGWPRDVWLRPTFTNHNEAQAPASDAVCQACVAMASKEVWESYVAAHPEQGLKTGHAMSWRFYSHAFTSSGHWCPRRPDWRRLLTDPPAPPFLFVLSQSGQKHLIFKARLAHDRGRYPLRWEDELLWVVPHELESAVVAVEAGMEAGLARSDMESLSPAPHRALKAGVRRTHALIEFARPHRDADPRLYALACYVAHKLNTPIADDAPKAQEDTCSTASTPRTLPAQQALF